MPRSVRNQRLAALLAAFSALAIVPVAAGSADTLAASSAPAAPYHWTTLRPSPLGPRSLPDLVWAGRELIELGGLRKGNTTNDGAAYDPATRRWHKIAAVRANVGFSNATTVWTGHLLFVTNGQTASCLGGRPVAPCLPHAGLYNPATNRWSTTLLPRKMDGLFPMAAVWTGRDVIVAGVNTGRGRLGVAAYTPATHRWAMITPRVPAAHPARFVAMVATPGRVILWSQWDRVRKITGGFGIRSGVDVLELRGGTWRDVTGNWPQHETITSPAFSDDAILVSPGQIWCGTACSPPFSVFPGFLASPVTLHRSIIPAGPLDQADPPFIWTAPKIIAFNLSSVISGPGIQVHPDDTALYNPSSRRWFRLPTPPHRPAIDTTPVWTGTELLALTSRGDLLALRP